MRTETVFSALGDRTRLTMLARLATGPQPVHLLAAGFPISRPAISRHLRVLMEAGLVRQLRRGRENLYGLVETGLDPVRAWLQPAMTPMPPPDPLPVAATTNSSPMQRARKRAPAPGATVPQLSLFD